LAYCLPPPRSKISMPRMPRKATRSIFSVAEKVTPVAGVVIDVGELLLLPNTMMSKRATKQTEGFIISK